MAVILPAKEFLGHLLHNAFIEGLVKGFIAGAIFVTAIMLTSEIATGLIIGGLGGLCVAECLTEKFHCEDCKAWHSYTGVGVGLTLGGLLMYLIDLESVLPKF